MIKTIGALLAIAIAIAISPCGVEAAKMGKMAPFRDIYLQRRLHAMDAGRGTVLQPGISEKEYGKAEKEMRQEYNKFIRNFKKGNEDWDLNLRKFRQ